MIINSGYIGKNIKIELKNGKNYKGPAVHYEEPEESVSGEFEIGINYASGILAIRESEIDSIEIIEE